MKIQLVLFLLFSLPLRAATVLLTVTGRVGESNAAAVFPGSEVVVGDVWTVTFTFESPRAADSSNLAWQSWHGAQDRFSFSVRSLFWTGQLAVTAEYEWFYGPQVHMGGWDPGSENQLPPVTPFTNIHLHWIGPSGMINDWSALPESFAQWNLPAAVSFELMVDHYEGQQGKMVLRASAVETMTIQVIPEPGAEWLSTVGAVAALGRRKRGTSKGPVLKRKCSETVAGEHS